MAKIIWSKYDEKGKFIKDGSIDGVPLKAIWKECDRESNKYYKKHYCKECGHKKVK